MDNNKKNIPNIQLTGENFPDFYDAFKKLILEENKNKRPINKGEVEKGITPLQEVFLPDAVMNGVLISVGLPELMEKEMCQRPGVVLYGPPGTGKSVLGRALVQSFSNLGAYSEELSVTSLQSMWMGEYPKKVEAAINKAKEEAQKRGVNSLLFFDEADILIEDPEGTTSQTRYYQDAINVLKRHLEGENSQGVTVIINTNAKRENFNEALVRSGRLTAFEIDLPTPEMCAKMWMYFCNKFQVSNLTPEQATEIESLTPGYTGADIYAFCEGSHTLQTTGKIVQEYKGSLLDALIQGKSGEIVSGKVVKKVSFEELRQAIGNFSQPVISKQTGLWGTGEVGFQPPKK